MLQEISDNYRIFTINNGLSMVKVLLEITIERGNISAYIERGNISAYIQALNLNVCSNVTPLQWFLNIILNPAQGFYLRKETFLQHYKLLTEKSKRRKTNNIKQKYSYIYSIHISPAKSVSESLFVPNLTFVNAITIHASK